MRIIAGKCRATNLYSFETETIGHRATLDRVKASIFDSLQSRMMDANVLDLFCGTGNLGLEAFSRGANVTMVDNSAESLKVARKNISKCHADGLVTLINADYNSAVAEFSRENKLFDIIFLDPPYDMDISKDLGQILSILSNDGIIVYEHDIGLEFTYYGIYKSRKMGRVIVEYISK